MDRAVWQRLAVTVLMCAGGACQISSISGDGPAPKPSLVVRADAGFPAEPVQVRSGLQLRGGLGYALWHGELFAEARYHYVGLRFASTGDANAGGITVGAGYRLAFDELVHSSAENSQ